MTRISVMPKDYSKEFEAIDNRFKELIKKKEEQSYVELERPLRKVGNSYFVQIPIDIARENNFENIKVKIQDKKASQLLTELMNELDKKNNEKSNVDSET